MRRQEAEAFYFFPDAYWQGMVDTGAGGELVLVEALLEGEVVASLLCFAHGPWLHYHLGASADAARNIGASNRCFLAAAEWAQSRGMTRFHLGGGVGAGTDSPLFQFKHRYDPTSEPHPFHIAKVVHDPARYQELAGTDSTAGFFPPWQARA
jgi:lipid II:glycine glycyltransferase (peptidoglycan interpeptide bridge formation enzyme)